VKRLDAGTYNVQVKARVLDAATAFGITAWTMDVELAK
jgi:hypothetical protein